MLSLPTHSFLWLVVNMSFEILCQSRVQLTFFFFSFFLPFTVSGDYWAVCSTYIGREISLGNRCPYKNCIHGHPGQLRQIVQIVSLIPSRLHLSVLFFMASEHIFILYQDIARLTFIALRNENVNGKLLTFAGPRAWTTQEVKNNIKPSLFFPLFVVVIR